MRVKVISSPWKMPDANECYGAIVPRVLAFESDLIAVDLAIVNCPGIVSVVYPLEPRAPCCTVPLNLAPSAFRVSVQGGKPDQNPDGATLRIVI